MADEQDKKKEVNLDDLIERLDPDVANKKAGVAKHQNARNKYHLKNPGVSNWDEFRKEVIKYTKHHHKKLYGTKLSDDKAWDKGKEYFKDEKGKPNVTAHYKNARDNKLAGVLNEISSGLESQDVQAYYAHVIDSIDPHDTDLKVKLMEQYKAKYKSILPKELKTKKAIELANNYENLIMGHASLVQNKKQEMEVYKTDKKKMYETQEKKAA